MRFKVLLGCLVLSGFCGLAYELLWTRLMSLTFGSTTLSFSVVLAVFFGGLALGAWLAGRWVTRGIARPVRAYALIEMLTGAFGLALYPILVRLDLVFVVLDPGSGTGLGGAMARLAAATPLLIIPTVLMGATLPIVCAAVIVRDEDVGRASALIYGFNTLGAFLGAYVVTYHLIPEIGVFRSILATAMVNFLVGGIALMTERHGSVWVVGDEQESIEALKATPAASGDQAFAPAGTMPDSGDERRLALVAFVLTFLSGFAFIAYEVVWARLFSAFLEGTVYGVGAVLICFLVGIAVGSLLIARHVPAGPRVGLWYAALQTLAVASVLALGVGLSRISHLLYSLAAAKGAGLVSQHVQLLVVFAALAIPTICTGASFPLLIKIVESRASRSGRALGFLYAVNTVGAILGSLVTGFVLIPDLGSVGVVMLATALVGLSAALGGALLTQGRRRLIGLGLAALAMLLLSRFQGFDVRLIAGARVTERRFYDQYLERQARIRQAQVYFAEGRNGTIAVSDHLGVRALNINGLDQGYRQPWPPRFAMESILVGLIPLVHVSSPEKVVVVGLGAGATIDILRESGVPRIVAVEIESRVVDAVDVIFRGQSPVKSRQVDVVTDDARHFLLVAARKGRDKYDVITSMPAHPWVCPNLFTREFFEMARVNLSRRGIFATWFGIEKMDRAATESLLRAFCGVFPHYVIYYVPDVSAYYLIGADHPLTFDVRRLERLSEQSFAREYPTLQDPYYLPTYIYATGNASASRPPQGVTNTDDSAFVEVHAPRSSGESPLLQEFLPHEYLLPEMVPERLRHDFCLELLERLLGTPNGRLPLRKRLVYKDRARRTLAASRALLSEQEQAYLDGRIAAESGQPDQARVFFEQAARGGGELARRAGKFSAVTYPRGSRERWDALRALESSSDVIIEMMAIDLDRAMELVPDTPRSPAEDPAGWLVWKAAVSRPGALGADDRAAFIQQVGSAILGSTRHSLVALGERFAREQGLALEAGALGERRRALAVYGAEHAFRKGLNAGIAGKFAEAADALWEANRLQPGVDSTMKLLLVALVKLDDRARLARLEQELRFIGRSERHVQGLVSAARSGELVFSETPQGQLEDLATGRVERQ